MTTKRGLQSLQRKALTPTEQKVFDMITKEFFNSLQIRKKLNCSRQNVSKHLRSIIKKGYLNSGNQPTQFCQPKCQPNKGSSCQPKSIPSLDNDEKIRLHGEEWHIEILKKDHNYMKLLKKCNTFQLSGHTIRLFDDVIEIYAGDGISFFGKDENDADRKALDYWYGFFSRLENYTKTILVKNGSSNIRKVNEHYESLDSEICENYMENEGTKIKVYCPIDGKLAFTTDESWDGKNDECLHPKTAKRDRGKIDKHVNDFRLNDPRTNSEIDEDLSQAKKILTESAKQIRENAINQGIYGKNSVTHVKLMKNIDANLAKQTELFEKIERALRK